MKAESQNLDAETASNSEASRPGLFSLGGAALLASIAFCASSHLILRGAASGGSDLIGLMLDPRILGGLLLYAGGTALWLLCLSRLDLSIAFPASAVQLLLVYGGARWFLGEEIPVLRLVGAAVILAGIAILFLEGRRRRV